MAAAEIAPAEFSEPDDLSAESETWRRIQQRVSWQYPFVAATRQPAKTSVSALRRLAAETDESAILEHATVDAQVAPALPPPPIWPGRGLPAIDIGNAHHSFLQKVSLAEVGTVAALRAEAQRLDRAGALTSQAAAHLDFAGLAAFWDSDLGRRIREKPQSVKRELAFTARFSADELSRITGNPADPDLEAEFVVVQGVADLAVILPEEIWLVDFKTDAIGAGDLAAKAKSYEPQLRLYAQALSQIYRRPVSESWLYFLARRQAVPFQSKSH